MGEEHRARVHDLSRSSTPHRDVVEDRHVRLTTIAFLLAGLVHLVPSLGALSAARLTQLYGVAIDGPELLLLMRHRAVLFGLLGALLIAAAFVPALRRPVGIAGLVSMLAFVVLFVSSPTEAAALRRVMWVDVAVSLVLAPALFV
jgi:hypothetical protein